uniref:Uncharacterized protein n=1 Tax=Aureoumbra lagunensis TaxID=44058 RepID=A0A7S3NGV5_9STRA
MIHDTIPPITTGIESNATSSINNPGLNQSSSSVPPQSEPTTKGQIVKKAKISEWVPAAIQWITENLVRHDSGKVHVATIRKMFTESNFFPDSELVNHDQVEMANLKYDLQNPKTASSKKFKALALESVVGTDCIRQNCFMNGSNELGLFGWIIKPQNSANNEQGAQKKSKAISSGQSEETILLSTTPHEPKGQNSVHTNTDGNDILPSPPTKNSENTTTPHHQHREQLQSPKQQQPKRHPHHHMSKYSSLPRPSPSININTVPSHQNHRTSFTFQSMPMDSHVHTSVQGPQGTTHIPPTFDDTSQSTEHNQQHQDKRARIAKSDFNDFATIHHSNQPDHIDNRQAMDSEYYHNQPQSVTLVSHVLDAVAPAPVSSEQDTNDNADAK